MRDVLKGCGRFPNAEARLGFRGRGFDQPLDPRCVDFAPTHGVETPVYQACGNGTGRKYASLDELPSVKISRFVSDLTRWNLYWVFHATVKQPETTVRLHRFAEGSKMKSRYYCSILPGPCSRPRRWIIQFDHVALRHGIGRVPKRRAYFAFFFTNAGQFLSALAKLPSMSALNFFRTSGFKFKYSLPLRICQVLMSTSTSFPRPTP